MPNRKLPFGYCLIGGQIQPAGDEAELVRMIFHRYIQGASYQMLADVLNAQSVRYLPDTPWNKNMIARIIQDDRSTGATGYPPIITPDEFQNANAARPKFSTRKRHSLSKRLRGMARCGICSGFVRRTPNGVWQCPCCISSSGKLTDSQVTEQIQKLLEKLADGPDLIAAPPPPPASEAVHILKSELAEVLNALDFDEDTARAKVLFLTAAQFDALGSEDYESLRIRDLLTKTEQKNRSDIELLVQIAAAILIYPTGSVSLKLKNRQVIEGSQTL